MNKQLLIIGKPHSSKTTFIAQLYSRLIKEGSACTLYKPVDDLTVIKDARDLLANGDEVKTTPTDRNEGINLPIQKGEMKFDLFCPDYGGEQILSIIRNREIDAKWKDAIKNSDNWILFIRLNNLKVDFDLSNKTISEEQNQDSQNSKVNEYQITDKSSFIELLQIMLHVKKNDYHKVNSSIKLTVVLTCWDEVTVTLDPKIPEQVLNMHIPLLVDFIKSNWQRNCYSIVGLSAQGFSLTEISNKEKYQLEGADNFGFFVNSDGTETNDITEILSVAI